MSVEVLISPRISFSHDVDVEEDNPSIVLGEPFPCSSSIDAGFDFDFAFSVDRQGALIRESSTADELFSDGKLLPVSINFSTNTEITDSLEPDSIQIRSPVFPCFETEEGEKEEKKKLKQEEKIVKSLKEHLEDSTDIEEDEDSKGDSPPPQATVARLFWKFGRSSSLNVSNYGRNRGKQSIPSKTKLLSRSKSTGAGLSRKPIEEEEGETKPGLTSVMEVEAGKSFWRFMRSDSLDCDKNCQNRGGLIGSLKVILLRSNSTGEVLARKAEEEARQFKIRRSSSLNCDGENRGRGLMTGYPSPLGRSNSTGSAYNLKQKELMKQNSARSSSSSSPSNAKTGDWKKRQGRRSFKDYYANFYRGERVNPVLNLPSPYISRASVDLLGFGSLFCNGRHRKKRK